MARIRTFKPCFFLNEELAQCNAYGRLLFIGLWCLADREGRLVDRPARIKAEIFPYETQDVDLLLEQLAQRGFIVRYGAVNPETGRISRYIEIPKFKSHQKPHHREIESVIPEPSSDLNRAEPDLNRAQPCLNRAQPRSSRADPDPDPDPATAAAAHAGARDPCVHHAPGGPVNRIAAAVAAMAAPQEEKKNAVGELVQAGCPMAIAVSALQASPPQLIAEILAFVRENPETIRGGGGWRSLFSSPEKWAFARTEAGWARPPPDKGSQTESTKERLDRIAREQSAARQKVPP